MNSLDVLHVFFGEVYVGVSRNLPGVEGEVLEEEPGLAHVVVVGLDLGEDLAAEGAVAEVGESENILAYVGVAEIGVDRVRDVLVLSRRDPVHHLPVYRLLGHQVPLEE